MSGKIIGIGILIAAIIAGAALYYLQIWGFYTQLSDDQLPEVQMVSLISEEPEAIVVRDIEAIDADSSPIRFRACFETDMSLASLTEMYVSVDDMTPRNAPPWFDCFNAEAIAEDIYSGTTLTFLGQKNIEFGVDRIVAVSSDGRGYIWHELNDCGRKAYDGTVVGEECPPREGN